MKPTTAPRNCWIRSACWQGRLAWAVVGFSLFLTGLASGSVVYHPRHGDPLLEPWRWTAFPELDGKGFACMAEGKDGSMWFGVQSGVIRYDGQRWTTYSTQDGLFDAQVTSICVARDGSIWVASNQLISSNLCVFTGGSWKSLLANGTNALKTSIVSIIQMANGAIWASLSETSWAETTPGESPGSFLRYRNGQFTVYRSDTNNRVALFPASTRFVLLPRTVTTNVCRVFEDADGRMWFTADSGEVAYWDPREGDIQQAQAWHACGHLEARWEPHVLQRRNGQILVGFGDGGKAISTFDSNASRWTEVATNIDRVNSMVEMQDGALLVGSHGRIAADRGGVWSFYDGADFGFSPSSLLLFQAADGDLWIGMRNGSVFRVDYSDKRWSSYEGLNFQGDDNAGGEWFLSVDGSVVCRRANQWTRYDITDGLISNPVRLLCTKDGRTWAAGSHDGVAASAVFENGVWHRELHPTLSWTVDFRSVFEGADGRLWLGGNNEPIPGKSFDGGLLCYDRSRSSTHPWSHLRPPQVPSAVCGIAQAVDGHLYYGGWSLMEQEPAGWLTVTNPPELATYWIDSVVTSPSGDLWVSRGGIGVFQRHNGVWTKFGSDSGLADLMVSTLLCDRDGTVWAATPKGISRFDGVSWTPNAFGTKSISIDRESGSLYPSRDGRIWVNSSPRKWYFRAKTGQHFDEASMPEFHTLAYRADRVAPDTGLRVTFDKVSQPGNTLIAWEGSDPWGTTPADQLAYSFRFDNGAWSPCTTEREKMFLSLPAGRHTFEVRARDLDLNVDPTPSRFQFTVEAPVWRQAWFRYLISAFLAVLGAMGFYVVRRNHRLRVEVGERIRAQSLIEQQKQRVEEQNVELEAQRDQLSDTLAERQRAEAELAHERELLRSLLDFSDDQIYFKDLQSRFTRCSRAQARLFKLSSAEELVGKSDFDFFTEEHARPAFEDEQEIIRTGRPAIGKSEKETHHDGHVTWALTSKMPLHNAAGDIIGTFGISKDITAIKQTEEALHRQNAYLTALQETTLDVISQLDLDQLLENIVKRAGQLMGTATGILDLLEPGEDRLTPKVASGVLAEESRKFSVRRGEGVAGKVWETGQPILIEDYDKWPGRLQSHQENLIRSIVEVPLHSKSGFVGVLGLAHARTSDRTFGADTIERLGQFARFATIAIENARLYSTIQWELAERKKTEAKLEVTHRQLLDASRQAGMAEVASNVLHNVGNVLNSLNVSATLAADIVRNSRSANLTRIVALLDEHATDLGDYLAHDAKGSQLPGYLRALSQVLADEQSRAVAELDLVCNNVEHIREIVNMQQNYARLGGVTESVSLPELVEDCLRINAGALTRHGVEVIREFQDVPQITVEKHKVLQILVNLIRNAKYACDEGERADKKITVRITGADGCVRVAVSDNGVGIPAENLKRIFNHGFTTRKDGHGFGLHSGALAATGMGGSLIAHSDGVGHGATFTLELAVDKGD